MAVTVEVMAMAPEAAMNMPVVVMPVVVMPVVVVVTVVMGTVVMTMAMTTMTAAMTDHRVNTAAARAATAATVTTVTTAMTATGVSSRRDERRQANNGRGDKSEKCSTFEHCERPFGSREPSEPVVGPAGPRVQTIDFQHFFVHLTFIDGAMVWHDGGPHHPVTACATARNRQIPTPSSSQ